MISIIIPTYNSARYICYSIESVLRQTYKDFEIIIVDDGSTDNTHEVIKKYQNRIKYYYTENKGVASARNLGILKSKGEYIAFLDSDDLYKPNKLEKQVQFLNSNCDIDVVYNDIEVVDENLKYINTLRSEGTYHKKEDFLSMMLVRQIIPGPASIMLRRRCIEKGIMYNENYSNAEDYDFTLHLAKNFKYGYIAETLYVYRRHRYNITNKHDFQVNNEIEIIKVLGIDNIEKLISESNFDDLSKSLILAKVLIKIKEFNIAKHVLKNILKKYSNDSAYFYLGNCYYFLNDYDSSKECFENAIKANNDMVEAYNNLGCILSQSDKDKGKECFKKALTLREGYMDAEFNIRNILENKDEFKLTKRELRKVLTLYNNM